MSDDNFLSRWSQRKREAARQAPAQVPTHAPTHAPDAPAPVEEDAFDVSLLPKLEDLTPESDISLFLRKGVPAALKNAALKRVWSLDPAIRDRVGDALDYAWDWNAPGGVPGGGELPPGFDAQSMVAKIFGDKPDDANVIQDVALQQGEPSSGADGPAAEPRHDEKHHETAQIETGSVGNSGLSDDGAPQRPRRHGGAMPS